MPRAVRPRQRLAQCLLDVTVLGDTLCRLGGSGGSPPQVARGCGGSSPAPLTAAAEGGRIQSWRFPDAKPDRLVRYGEAEVGCA